MIETRPKMWRYAFLTVAASFAVGARSSCDRNPPTLRCELMSLSVNPGGCVEFENPCGEEWVRLDAFRLCEGPPGLFVRSLRNPRRRLLCAASGADPEPALVTYVYTTPSDLGQERINVSLDRGPFQSVSATANPPSIALGSSSQLGVTVSEGVPPFIYSWAPANTLDDPTSPTPIARPSLSTEYVVTVTDAEGARGVASVEVTVDLAVVTNATPLSVAAGEQSNLVAFARGGTPPHTFSWTPSDSLDDASSQTPVASPMETTTYTVAITDRRGATVNGAVTVTVAPSDGGGEEVCATDFGSQLVIRTAADLAPFEASPDAPCIDVLRSVIIDDSNFVDLSGMERVASIEPPNQLQISNNLALSSLNGLDRLAVVGQLRISNNPTLASLAGLAALTEVDDLLQIHDNDALIDLTGLAGLIHVARVDVQVNDGLSSLVGLHNLATTDWIFISGNSSLTDLTGLESLTSVASFIDIQNNASLTSLDGLDGLASAGEIKIQDNPSLTSISALLSIQSATETIGVIITNNPLLPQSEIDALFAHLESVGFAGSTMISSNGL